MLGLSDIGCVDGLVTTHGEVVNVVPLVCMECVDVSRWIGCIKGLRLMAERGKKRERNMNCPEEQQSLYISSFP